jgi:hypothetical protein
MGLIISWYQYYKQLISKQQGPMKTWMMYKNHYGNALPSPVYQSNLRAKRQSQGTAKNSVSRVTPKDRSKTECYPARFYAYQLIVAGVLLLIGIALIAGYAPEIAQFMGL